MHDSPLISVIIPVFNAARDLPRCLDSLIAQTWPHLEILVVNDGSNDESGDICNMYAKRDSRIRIFHQANAGAFAARNRALDHARGQYIGFVDADDWIEADMYETLWEKIRTTSAEVAQCSMAQFGPIKQIRINTVEKTYRQPEILDAVFKEELSMSLCDKLFSANIWAHRRFEEAYYHVDAMTVPAILAACTRVEKISDTKYHYNTGSIGITRGERTLQHLKSKEKLFDAWHELLEVNGDANGNGAFYLCREISCRSWQVRKNQLHNCRDIQVHNRKMKDIFVHNYKKAKKNELYSNFPLMKKIIWLIYANYPNLIYLAYIMLDNFSHNPNPLARKRGK